MPAAGQPATRQKERIYLGAVEIYREYGTDPTTPALIRETLHVDAASEVVCLDETRTRGTDPGAAELMRYQYANHLGSAVLELDDQAQIISYEEYFPYGSTSYQARPRPTDTPKRYRYTGKERDDENDLYYHGARYYAPWLGRWTACDPAGSADGANRYQYVHGNPVCMSDPNGTQGERQPQEEPTQKPSPNSALNSYASGVGSGLLSNARSLGNQLKFLIWDNFGGLMYDITGSDVYKAQKDASSRANNAIFEFLKAGPEAAVKNAAAAATEPLDEMNRALSKNDPNAALYHLGRFMGADIAPLGLTGPEESVPAIPQRLADESIVVKAEGMKVRSVGAAARDEHIFEVVHHLNEKVGLPDLDELVQQLIEHRDAVQEILDTEGGKGLANRMADFQANKGTQLALRKEINQSLGSPGPGKAWLHFPDPVAGGGPLAVKRACDSLVNSIMGPASRKFAQQILAMTPAQLSELGTKRVVMKVTIKRK